MEREEAIDFFSKFYGGEHHIIYPVKRCGEGWSTIHLGELASYDFATLTKLIVLSHQECIRSAVRPAMGKPGFIEITIHPREREGSTMERHPDLRTGIEQMVDYLKN